MSEASQGLGDTVAKVASALGFDRAAVAAAKAAGKSDCGCKKRQQALNRLVPYRSKDAQVLDGPRPKVVLQGILNTPELRARMWEQTLPITASYPAQGAVLLPWVCLQNAGVTTYYHAEVSGWVRRLVHQGMRMLPVSMVTLEPGDLWVKVDAEKHPAECGLVVAVGGAEFLSFDWRGVEARPEAVRGVDYVLRLP